MREANFTVSSMHGDMPQKERDAIAEEVGKAPNQHAKEVELRRKFQA